MNGIVCYKYFGTFTKNGRNPSTFIDWNKWKKSDSCTESITPLNKDKKTNERLPVRSATNIKTKKDYSCFETGLCNIVCCVHWATLNIPIFKSHLIVRNVLRFAVITLNNLCLSLSFSFAGKREGNEEREKNRMELNQVTQFEIYNVNLVSVSFVIFFFNFLPS